MWRRTDENLFPWEFSDDDLHDLGYYSVVEWDNDREPEFICESPKFWL